MVAWEATALPLGYTRMFSIFIEGRDFKYRHPLFKKPPEIVGSYCLNYTDIGAGGLFEILVKPLAVFDGQ